MEEFSFTQQELLDIIDDKVKYIKKLRKEKDDEINTLTATIAQKDAEIERLRYALMDIDSYVDDESKNGRIIRKALEEVNDEK